ncbi:unnamed protein product [Spodoptera littoralis]|uniref:Uncharacterized protein n=1 Tax=Spodoptera littoralis TaxID=7109 RepID=A0A9P0IB77_SPOLI|nr:unnamed protein product [Spodoptera littoralis]CAH1643525.1 unnamed protein product [Spodoptera littoralis]
MIISLRNISITIFLIISISGENCDGPLCSHVFDEVCGMAELKDGTQIIKRYKNFCYMKAMECELSSVMEINQVADDLCGIKKIQTRREMDHTLTGAIQVCNHSCPLSCTEVSDPVCAKIWRRYSTLRSSYRPFINHCHVDLFSCTTGLNVTIVPIYSCYGSPRVLTFLEHIAIMKYLNIMD